MSDPFEMTRQLTGASSSLGQDALAQIARDTAAQHRAALRDFINDVDTACVRHGFCLKSETALHVDLFQSDDLKALRASEPTGALKSLFDEAKDS
jgi:hypothetical protein